MEVVGGSPRSIRLTVIIINRMELPAHDRTVG